MDNGSSADHILIAIEEDGDIGVEVLMNTMKSKIGYISPFSATSCIFRVPHVLRRNNPGPYGPDIVSIGPLHDRTGKQFELIENLKKSYLHDFLSRTNISLERLIYRTLELEKHARDFYAEPLDLTQHDLIEMMIFDGCFLVELFLKFEERWEHEECRDISDPIFNMKFMRDYLFHDLLVLENQLPWFILEYLYSLEREKEPVQSLKQLVLTVFTDHPPVAKNCKSYLNYLDSGSYYHDDDDDIGILHILDLIRTSIVFACRFGFEPSFYDTSETPFMHPVTTLVKSGVKVQISSGHESMMKIVFQGGVLSIPQVGIGELSESLFRNLIAFEQCCHSRSHEITSYVIFMDTLIRSSEDMDFLCEKKIIGNWGSIANSYRFFNELRKNIRVTKFHYHRLCAELDRYCTAEWEKPLISDLRREALLAKEEFRRHFLSNLLKIMYLVVCFIFVQVIPVILQTTYTIKQYYQGKT